MKKTVLIMLVFAVSSCNLLDGGYFLGTKRSDVLRENNYRGKVSEPEPESKQEKDTIIYVTGVDFPIGYDWRRDTSYGNVRSSIVLFANGKKIKSIPVGDEYLISPEPDRHRLVEDKIYTDFSFSGETIIKCDAEEVFRYKGEETIKGFMAYENNVYTLGKRLDGTGFTFRKNGELIFEGENGEILGNICDKPTSNGAIFYDNGICFIYYRFDWKEGKPEKRWFIVRDGNEKEMEITGDYNILDICLIRGEICYLYMRNENLTMNIAGRKIKLKGVFAGKNPECRFVISDNNIYLLCKMRWSKNVFQTTVLNHFGEIVFTYGGRAVYLYTENDKYACPLINDDSKRVEIYLNERLYAVNNNLYMLSKNCAKLSGGKFYVAFTSSDRGHYPFLWRDGSGQTIKLNGYLTSLEVVVK